MLGDLQQSKQHVQEGKTSSSRTVVVCSHCKSRGHSRRTCPQLQPTTTSSSSSSSSSQDQQSNSITGQATETQHATNGTGNGRTIRLVKGSQTKPRQQQSQSREADGYSLTSTVDKEEKLRAETGVRGEGSSEEEEEAVGEDAATFRAKCSYCGARAGHNARSCPKRQEDEESRARKVCLSASC